MKDKKIIIANWCKSTEMLGGQETFFGQLSRSLNAKFISYETASQVLRSFAFASSFNILYRGYVIDKYLKWYEKLFDLDLIIKNSAIEGMIELKTPQIIIFQDPYYSILKKMLDQETFIYNPEHHLGCIELMRRTAAKPNTTTVAVSNFMKKEMEECQIVCNKVILEGIDVEKFVPVLDKEKLKKDHNLPLDKKIGIAVTKFIPQKGWSILSKLIKEFQDIHWIIILTEKFDIKPKLKNVTIVEEVLPEIMPRLYNCADFFISTSPVESFGLSAAEAAACDLPIINFKTGWAWDFWDKRLGLRVDSWDYESFKKAVKDLFAEGHMKYEPRKAIIEKGFTSEKMKENWKKFVDEVLNKNTKI